jgi:hypothetical protein
MPVTLIDRDDLRRKLMAILNARPFDVDARTDGQYAGLRQAVRMLDEMPECEVKK